MKTRIKNVSAGGKVNRKAARTGLITAILVIGSLQAVFIADQLSDGQLSSNVKERGILSLIIPPEKPSSAIEDVGARSTAYQLAKEHIKRQLTRPNTARFPSMADEGVTFTADGRDAIRVDAYIQYKNGLDLTLKSQYFAVVRFEGSDVRVQTVEFKDEGRFVKPPQISW